LIRSMTSYGRGEFRTEDLLFVVEVRSVNHRYRDILLRLPKNLQSLEDALRNEISARVRRGRVEVSVQTQSYGDSCPITLKLNMPLVRAYQKVFEELADHFKVDRHLSLEAFCQIKDVLIVEPKPVQMDKEEKALREALKQALDSCDEMRIREGSAIENDMVKRLQLLKEYLEEMEKGAQRVVEAYRTRLRGNIQQLLQETTVDESRLAQEVAYYAERSDTTEEIVRLRSHLEQFHTYRAADDAVGRRLDFLIQEMSREVNTIGSKSSDSSISLSIVEMKAELEKLREQIQNVE
jgi:uncharacterized protein (TIGR00255 family)